VSWQKGRSRLPRLPRRRTSSSTLIAPRVVNHVTFF
jgi:hypothetical protein